MTDHRGQHANCRRCGTNPRATSDNPRGQEPVPERPVEPMSATFDRIIADNREHEAERDVGEALEAEEAKDRIATIRAGLAGTPKEET